MEFIYKKNLPNTGSNVPQPRNLQPNRVGSMRKWRIPFSPVLSAFTARPYAPGKLFEFRTEKIKKLLTNMHGHLAIRSLRN